MMRPSRILLTFALAALAGPAGANPMPFELGLHLPPVVVDSQAPSGCTVTWLVADTVTNDLFAARMRIEADERDQPSGNRLPCPAKIAPRVAARALDLCASRSLDPKTCVYGDMSRGFEQQPDMRNTAENASRCTSDKASHIGVACFQNGNLAICNIGCGNAPEEAVAAARARCEDKQQRSCPMTASVPIAGP